MNIHQYKDFVIEVWDEPLFSLDHVHKNFNYSKHFGDEGPTKYGVKVLKNDELIYSCIVFGQKYEVQLYKDSTVVFDDKLLIVCSDTLFSIGLPELELQWQIELEYDTILHMYSLGEDFLIHGETCIYRIDTKGTILWEFSGIDIFVNMNGAVCLQISDEKIHLLDFENNQYILDLNGNLISDTVT